LFGKNAEPQADEIQFGNMFAAIMTKIANADVPQQIKKKKKKSRNRDFFENSISRFNVEKTIFPSF
jgi:hypothetical protein